MFMEHFLFFIVYYFIFFIFHISIFLFYKYIFLILFYIYIYFFYFAYIYIFLFTRVLCCALIRIVARLVKSSQYVGFLSYLFFYSVSFLSRL